MQDYGCRMQAKRHATKQSPGKPACWHGQDHQAESWKPTCLQDQGACLQGLLLLGDVGHQLRVLRLQLLGRDGRRRRHASSDANWLHGRTPNRAADLVQQAACHRCARALHLHGGASVVYCMWSWEHAGPPLGRAKALHLHADKGALHGVLGAQSL